MKVESYIVIIRAGRNHHRGLPEGNNNTIYGFTTEQAARLMAEDWNHDSRHPDTVAEVYPVYTW